jgi:SAM-dependent methyltransferase
VSSNAGRRVVRPGLDLLGRSVDPPRHQRGEVGEEGSGDHRCCRAVLLRRLPAFLAGAAIRPTDRVLDIGCGTGVSTRAAARAAHAGHAHGVDLSSQTVDVARRLAAREGLTNASFERADAQVHPFEAAAFDVVISRAGAMFFGRPVSAFANLRRSLTAGGRLVLLTWQSPSRQEWLNALLRALTGRPPPPPDPARPGPARSPSAIPTGCGRCSARPASPTSS